MWMDASLQGLITSENQERKRRRGKSLSSTHEQSVLAYIWVGFAVAIIHTLISLSISSNTRLSAKSILENHPKCGITTGGKVRNIELLNKFISKAFIGGMLL